MMNHLAMVELQAGLERIRQSPKDAGVLKLIVRRPKIGDREILQEGQLDLIERAGGGQLEHARIVSDNRRLSTSGHAAERHELPCHRSAGPAPRTMVFGGRPAFCRPGLERLKIFRLERGWHWVRR